MSSPPEKPGKQEVTVPSHLCSTPSISSIERTLFLQSQEHDHSNFQGTHRELQCKQLAVLLLVVMGVLV